MYEALCTNRECVEKFLKENDTEYRVLNLHSRWQEDPKMRKRYVERLATYLRIKSDHGITKEKDTYSWPGKECPDCGYALYWRKEDEKKNHHKQSDKELWGSL